MPRIRTIKPEFPQSESMGRISRDARLCFIMLWTLADDAGRLRGSDTLLASVLFPYDDDAVKHIGKWLAELEREQCVSRYKVNGNQYVAIQNWLSHQRIDKPTDSKLPAPGESSEDSKTPRDGSRAVPVGMEGKGEDRKGTGSEDASPVLLTFPTDGKPKSWDLTADQVAKWSELFPRLDVLDECRQALAWVLANERKTARGMAAFLTRWFGRSTNSPRSNGKGKTNSSPAFIDRQAAMLERNAAGGKIEIRPEIPTTVRLANLAASLPETLPAVGRWRREITALTGETAEVERVLDAMDVRMLAAMRDELSAETLAAMDAKVRKAQALASKRSAEPPSEIASRIWPQLIREHYDCPRLSTFSNEAICTHPPEAQ